MPYCLLAVRPAALRSYSKYAARPTLAVCSSALCVVWRRWRECPERAVLQPRAPHLPLCPALLCLALRALREKYPDLRLQVDGGIDASTCSDAVDAGADVLVAGSYIFRAGDAAEAVAALREAFPPETSPRGKRWPWQR